jgi:p21-activated kinase 1
MDAALPNGSSQRRKLIKKPPPSAHHHSASLSVDGVSLQSKRSSASLKRAPSAPQPARTPTTTAAAAAANSTTTFASEANSSPRHHNYSPPPGHGVAPPRPINRHSDSLLQHQAHVVQGPLTTPSEDFVGAPFDGAAILNRIDAIKSPSFVRPAPPSSSSASRPGLDSRQMAPPPLRQSASFSTADSVANEKMQPITPATSQPAASKRYSDEGKEAKMPGVLRKKSGFSGFVSGLVGTPKKPVISAPENPVHVTHVGYDSTTGQFTVGRPFSPLPRTHLRV